MQLTIVKSAGKTLRTHTIKKGEVESWVLGLLRKKNHQNGFLRMLYLLWIQQYMRDSNNI